jgi:SpoVK/Ycf46/Vps4 family AAA+-type ATPase
MPSSVGYSSNSITTNIQQHSNKKPSDNLTLYNISNKDKIDISNNVYNCDFSNDIYSTYTLWQNEHETIIPLDVSNSNKPTKHVDISFNLESLDNLIDVLDKYPYEQNTSYNIDLKSLHNIHKELIMLNNMIGMKKLKKSILQQMIYFIQKLHLSDNTTNKHKFALKQDDFKHTMFTGPPGTGKTEMAKIIGNMYAKLGILKNNTFKKVTRNDLVAGYLGQTALKTKKVVEECLGGVLFIDEAYSFGTDDSYSKECIDTLCECLSDHKHDLMVIIAGYENELNETFFRVNAGMKSRFIWKFTVESYDSNELMLIFEKLVLDAGWDFAEDYKNNSSNSNNSSITKWFSNNKKKFVNFGRDMEVLFSYVKISHAQRIFGKDISIRKKISRADLENGYETFLENKKEPESSMSRILSSGMYV